MNLLTHRGELATVAPFVVQAGPLALFRCSAAQIFPLCSSDAWLIPPFVEERKSHLMWSRRCYGFSES
jgi:hypothetical protein